MKNNILKTIIVPFAITFLLTISSCSSEVKSERNLVHGDHENNSTETVNYVIKNNASNYSIVIPKTSSSALNTAYEELVRLVKEATGVTLSVVTDEGLTHSSQGHYISLGNTTLLSSSGLALDMSKLKRDGFYVRTKDRSIYLVGGSDTAIIYAVDELMHYHFNFECYYKDTYVIDKNVKELKLYDYQIFENPDIDYRTRKGVTLDDDMFAYRLRCQDSYGDFLFPIHKGDTKGSESNKTHNSFTFLPDSEYREKYPDMYTGNQLCFTAHGNQETYNKMIEICAKKVANSIMWYPKESFPSYSYIQFGIMDDQKMCSCSACQELMNRNNGAHSATIIKFLIDLGKKVNAWMDENPTYKRDDIKYTFLAYQDSLMPPCLKDSDGKYYIRDELKSNEVVVMPYVAFSGFNYSKGFYDSANDAVRGYMEAWGTCYPGAWAWAYGTFFNDFLSFYDSYTFYTDYHNNLYKYKFTYAFEQIHSDQRGSDSGFHAMSNYCLAKLAWDSTLEMKTLMNNYMHAMFDVAYDTMQYIYDECELWFRTWVKDKASTTHYRISSDANFWTGEKIGFIYGLFNKFNQAYKDIEIYQKDVTTYNRLKSHIDMEWLFPAKVALSVYKDYMDTDEWNAIKVKFKKVIEELGLLHVGEFKSINEFLNTLGD